MELDQRVGEVEGITRIDTTEDQSEESRNKETHGEHADVDRHRESEDVPEEGGLSIPPSEGDINDGLDLV